MSDETNQNLLLDNLYKEWYKIRPSSLWTLEAWVRKDEITGSVKDSLISFNVLNAEDIVYMGDIIE